MDHCELDQIAESDAEAPRESAIVTAAECAYGAPVRRMARETPGAPADHRCRL